MIPPPAPIPAPAVLTAAPAVLTAAPAVLTAAQERDLARLIRAGRRARLLAQRHLAARLRRDLSPAVNARAAAGAVLAAPLPAPVPLDQIMGDGETTTLGDLLPDPDADQPAALAEAHALAAAVRAALATLDPRARAILVARHGLDGAPPRTLQEIGRSLGLTRQAVQQAKARALTRLRDPALRHWLADDATPAAS